jgi:outer membrane protein OmpA-like peptidoglycan-associated protein
VHKTLIAIAVTIALTGCSTPPKLDVPGGGSRQSINSPAKIEEYKARTAEETANYNERAMLSRQVDSLNKQVAELKTYLLLLQMQLDSNGKGHPALAAVTHQEVQKPGSAGESLEVRGQSVIFRVTHPYGKTAFAASGELQEKLLKAARQSRRIDIRGRTDASYDNPIDRKIAMQRALRARRFLIANGIEPGKIRVSWLAANDHVADNRTVDGRAKNRRVEIETKDIDTTAFNSAGQPPVKIGGAQ